MRKTSRGKWYLLVVAATILFSGLLTLRSRSGWTSDELVWQRAGPASRWDWVIASRHRSIWLGCLSDSSNATEATLRFNSDPTYSVGFFCLVTVMEHGTFFSGSGFGFCFGPVWGNKSTTWNRVGIVAVPHAALIAATALCALLGLTKLWQTRAKQSPMTCRTCGYDLRATPDRCPECGTGTAGKEKGHE